MEILSTEYEKQIEEILSQQKNLDEEFKTKEEELRKNLAKVQAELIVLVAFRFQQLFLQHQKR